ncbi:uncharacterized protein LOC131616902 [Vicia villosa]|uniref:uncharacterized protein LOC131616902 n=1 Tax=Vicia villosa TaxID=3911 RepID=UPI00273CE1E9|nr:uncharacterized protein LOC131616902 [Vicia villosa]
MVTEGIVLGHKISSRGLEVDQAKVEVISKLPPPINIKGVRSFLGHAGFYRRFVKDFSKIAKPLSNLLNKDHLSRLVNVNVTNQEAEINDEFPDEQLFQVQIRPWFADLANHKATGMIPVDFDWNKKKKLLSNVKYYLWDDPYLFKIGADGILRRCVTEEEAQQILWHCHNSPSGGHFNGWRTTTKVLQSGFFWPTVFEDAHHQRKNCDKCQRVGGISKRDKMPLQTMIEVEVFDCWGIDFMGPFLPSFANEYILVAVDYVSKWVEAIATPKAGTKIVLKFLNRNIFTRFGMPRVIISDGGSHFVNEQVAKVLDKYGINHKIAPPYHPQTNGTAYKAPTGSSPFQMVYGKACHLPVEVEHRELWPLRFFNRDDTLAYKKRRNQIHELEEFRLRLFLRKLKSKWSGPFKYDLEKVHALKPKISCKDAKTPWLGFNGVYGSGFESAEFSMGKFAAKSAAELVDESAGNKSFILTKRINNISGQRLVD